MDCSGEGTRHVTDSGKGSLPIRRTVTCARCDGEGLIYVGPEEGREEALRRLRGGRGGGEASGGGRALAAAVDLKEAGDAAYGAQDYAAAVQLYRKAADQNNAAAMNRMGECYYYGRSVPEDYTQAVQWYDKAARAGNIEAKYNMGYCKKMGQGTSKDMKAAFEYFRQAAEGECALCSALCAVCVIIIMPVCLCV